MATAWIAGASGLVGGQLLPLLLASGRYAKVTALGRRPLPPQPGLESLVVDFNDLDNVLPGSHVDDVFCCLGTTMKTAGSQEAFRHVDFHCVVELAGLARERGARQFLMVSAMGANAGSPVFYNRVKGEAEEAVKALRIPSVAIFQPSLLLGDRQEHRAGERVAMALAPVFSPLLAGPLRKYRPIEARDVAKAMVAVAASGVEGVQVLPSDEIARRAV